MNSQDSIEPTGQLVAGRSPVPNLLQPESRGSQHRRIKILMGNRVSPEGQFLQTILASLIAKIQPANLAPESQAKPVVIGSDISGICISFIQHSILCQNISNGNLNQHRDTTRQVICTFRMQVAAEALKLRGQ